MASLLNLSAVALRPIFRVACETAGIPLLGDATGALVGFLTKRYTDHSQKLTQALRTANERAWKAFEIALGGQSLWDRFKVALSRTEDRAFAEQVRAFLVVSPLTKYSGKYQDVFRQALQEIRSARSKGLLTDGSLAAVELARHAGPLVRFDNPQAVLAAEWKLIERTAGELRPVCPNLCKILVTKPNPEQPSLLAVGVHYYFRRAVETDQELFQGLAFSKLEALEERQQKGFAELTNALRQRGQRLEEMLADVVQVLTEIRTATADTNARMKALEGKIQQLLEQRQLHNREVRPSDSMSMRSEGERQLVKQLGAQYRALPEEQRRNAPELLNNLGKLEVAVGDFDAAQQDFATAATLAKNPRTLAEVHHNAYGTALERGDRTTALKELTEAVRLDAARFAPFPFARYEPQRILGAGGFGVVFLCQHRNLGRPVVIKSLLASELDRDVTDLFKEAQVLEDLNHPAIIKVRDGDYADEARKRPYLVMEYFEGMNLADFVAGQGTLSPDDLLAIVRSVAEALQAAHACGILHRDVKPANVLVRPPVAALAAAESSAKPAWQIKLIDFGLALRPGTLEGKASTQGSKARTAVGRSIAGTLHYAAPEQMGQAPGVSVGKYSDVYGFGRTCYFALLGTPDPDDGEKDVLPEAWRRLLSQCTRRKETNRLPDFAAVLAELARMSEPVRKEAPAPAPLVPTESKPSETTSAVEEAPRESPPAPTVLNFQNKGLGAHGYETSAGFVVQAGAQAIGETAPSIPLPIATLRATLLQEGILTPDGANFKLTRDYTFSSPSSAASVLAGGSRSGPDSWKDEEGTKLRDLIARRQTQRSKDPNGREENGARTEPDEPDESNPHGQDAERSRLAAELFANARASQEGGEHREALKGFKQALKAGHPEVEVCRFRAKSFLARGETESALADLNTVVSREKQLPDGYLARGDFYSSAGEYEKAVADFSTAIRLDLRNVGAYLGRGLAYDAKGASDLALADYNEAVRLAPQRPDILCACGRSHLLQGRYDAARVDAEQARNLQPDYAPAHHLRGQALRGQGAPDDALAAFIETIRLDPNHADAYCDRGEVYAARGNDEQAISDFNQALLINRRLARAYHQRGLAYLRLGKIGTAQWEFTYALNIEPKNVRYLIDRGHCHYLRGNCTRAIEDLNLALRYDADNLEARRLRGLSHGKAGTYGRAILDLTAVIDAGQVDPEMLAMRSEALCERKRPDEAEADAVEALRRDPNCAAALAARGCVHAQRNESEQALADFGDAIRLQPKESRFYFFRARHLRKLGRHAEAVADLTKAIKFAPEDAVLYERRAQSYDKLGEKDKAQADRDKAAQLSPDSSPSSLPQASEAGDAAEAGSAETAAEQTPSDGAVTPTATPAEREDQPASPLSDTQSG
jgi:tetratricopeptide (TPR) repeat protein